MPVKYNTPFSRIPNPKNKSATFKNFGLPAIGTCLNAPDVCKSVCNKKPLCFAVRPVINWPFTDQVANMDKSNCIYKQYANLYLTFNKDKKQFCEFLDKVLCPTMLRAFLAYQNENIKAYDSQSEFVKGMNSQNIWNKLVIHYEGNNDDFLPYIQTDSSTFKFTEYMINIISKFKSYQKDVYMKIHYSGDFYSEEYFGDWVKIADYFRDNENIKFMAHTQETSCIENWTKDNNRGLINGKNGINIKLIFSEMSGDRDLDTSKSDVSIFC